MNGQTLMGSGEGLGKLSTMLVAACHFIPEAQYGTVSKEWSRKLAVYWGTMASTSSLFEIKEVRYCKGEEGHWKEQITACSRHFSLAISSTFVSKFRVTVLCFVASFTTFSSVGKPFRLRISSTNFPVQNKHTQWKLQVILQEDGKFSIVQLLLLRTQVKANWSLMTSF